MDEDMKIWKRAALIHGHECGGLMIGYKASLYAIRLLDIDFSPDEQLACIAEDDACSVDAIQFILKYSVGKGNLMFHLTGKQAFSIYNKKNGRSVRLVLKPDGYRLTRSEAFDYYRGRAPEEIFDVKETKLKLPAFTRPFESYICDMCGEPVSSNCIRLCGDKKLCIDCYGEVDHFHM